MGAPYWQIAGLLRQHRVHVCSSNYALYGDMSERVMNILQAHCADVEVYSIDESFLKLNPFKNNVEKLIQQQIELRKIVLCSVGIPISIGIAPTKTLAKLANHFAKKESKEGVFFLDANSDLLEDIPVGKVWGIARGYQKRLAKVGVRTVGDLTRISTSWMRKEFGVVGVRLLKELKGEPCYELDSPVSERKNVMVSRSFRRDVYELRTLKETIAVYTTRLGEKLRRYNQIAGTISVFLMANRHKKIKHNGRGYRTMMIELPIATSATNELISTATKIVDFLYEKGVNYKKAGVLASGLRPAGEVQGNLFVQENPKNKILMKTIDQINAKMGRGTILPAACGNSKNDWSRKAQWCSPSYTTKWSDILKIKI